jgi:hypothetical protein
VCHCRQLKATKNVKKVISPLNNEQYNSEVGLKTGSGGHFEKN